MGKRNRIKSNLAHKDTMKIRKGPPPALGPCYQCGSQATPEDTLKFQAGVLSHSLNVYLCDRCTEVPSVDALMIMSGSDKVITHEHDVAVGESVTIAFPEIHLPDGRVVVPENVHPHVFEFSLKRTSQAPDFIVPIVREVVKNPNRVSGWEVRRQTSEHRAGWIFSIVGLDLSFAVSSVELVQRIHIVRNGDPFDVAVTNFNFGLGDPPIWGPHVTWTPVYSNN